MQADPNSALYYRTKGWDFIERGQELFNDPQKPNDKKKGYMIFKKGLECMLMYAKSKILLFSSCKNSQRRTKRRNC